MTKYAVIGWPVEHSVSPQMQNAGLQALGVDATYEKLAVAPEALRETFQQKLRHEYAGWNITVPHKQDVLPLLDNIEPTAARIGSVNTVVNRDGCLTGFSTDGYGLAMALKESFGLGVQGRRFVFIGAGGAARATAAYFAREGASAIGIINRTSAKAEAIASLAHQMSSQCEAHSCNPEHEVLVKALLAEADAVIQATSLGLRAGDAMPLNPEWLPEGVPLYDMIYRKTPFLKTAEQRGCPVADGAGMLLHQGARSLEMWTGRDAPVEAMRTALMQALAG